MPLGLGANSVSFFSCPALAGHLQRHGCRVPIERQVWARRAANPGPKGKLSVRLNGTNPLRTREALRVDASCYSNELLLSPREPPMCPEASPPTRPSFLASASVEGGYRRSSGMSIRKSLASYFSCNAATLRLRRGGLRFVLTRLKHVANGCH